MTHLAAHTKSRIRNLGKSALYRIAADEGCEYADVIELLSTTSMPSISGAPAPFMRLKSTTNPDIVKPISTPPQPERSSSHAPAAQADGEASPPPSTSPSVDTPSPSAKANAPEPESRSPVSRQPGSGDFFKPRKVKNMDARERIQTVFDAHPNWPPSKIAKAADVHVSTCREWLRQKKAGEAKPVHDREAQIKALFEGGAPTASEAAHALGYVGQGGVRKLAKRLGLTFRVVTKEETAEKIRAGMQHTAVRTATTEALRRAVEKPQEAAEPPQAPEAHPEPEQPPPAKYEPVQPPVQRDASDVLHRTTREPQGRFYLRERVRDLTVAPRFVHQSLLPNPNGDGPMMTSVRGEAWHDNMQRYRGAMAKWPQLKAMLKEVNHA